MTPGDAIQALLDLFASFRQKPRWTGRSEVVLDDAKHPVDFDVLRQLGGADILASLKDTRQQAAFDSGISGEVPGGDSILLRVPRQWDRLLVAKDFDDLLSLPIAKEKTPSAYVVCDIEGESSPVSFVRGDAVESLPSILQRYHQALDLWEMIKSYADHEDVSGSVLFFGTRRIELAPGFGKDDLAQQLWVPPIKAFMSNQDRQETRREILLAVLSDLLRDQSPEQAFRYLLGSKEILNRQLKEGMAIYLAEHSPEKLEGEARASALALSETLEKIIAGLEAKGLSIPAAILLAVKEVQPNGPFSGVNLMILLSLLTFAITMTIIHLSQRDLITQLEQTIAVAIADLKRKGLDGDNPVLKDKFTRLQSRARRALKGSNALRWASWMPLVCVTVATWYAPTKPKAKKQQNGHVQKDNGTAVSQGPNVSNGIQSPNVSKQDALK